MKIIQVPCWEDNYSYILHLKDQVLVIDPCDPDLIFNKLNQLNFNQLSIINTHHHPDHINGNTKIFNHYQNLWNRPIDVFCSERDMKRVPFANHFWPLTDQNVRIGEFEFVKLHTPGHTEGHCCLYFAKDSALFCADVLFSLGCGKLFEGTGEELFNSHEKLLSLPMSTTIYCAHEYTLDNLDFTEWVWGFTLDELRAKFTALLAEKNSTIPTNLGFELQNNLFLSCRDPQIRKHLMSRIGSKSLLSPLEAFKILRNTRNLGPKPSHFVI